MDVPGMESLAHHAENLLGLVRDGRIALDPCIAELLLQAVNKYKRIVQMGAQRRSSAAMRQIIPEIHAGLRPSGGTVEAAETPRRSPCPDVRWPGRHGVARRSGNARDLRRDARRRRPRIMRRAGRRP
jgi:chemotaxis protein histidine kinase CheA